MHNLQYLMCSSTTQIFILYKFCNVAQPYKYTEIQIVSVWNIPGFWIKWALQDIEETTDDFKLEESTGYIKMHQLQVMQRKKGLTGIGEVSSQHRPC